jgi:phosphonopyruvate decarboxylase
MLSRRRLVQAVLAEMGDRDCIVAGLGFIARDLYALAGPARDQCLYCLGSMGSTIPLALGLHLGRPDLRVLALEGDGSLLSNLGTLATSVRYGDARLAIVIVDNRRYESSGGQPSQADGLRLEAIAAATGLTTFTAIDSTELARALASWGTPGEPPVIVVAKTESGPPAARIIAEPDVLRDRFARALPGRACPATPGRLP